MSKNPESPGYHPSFDLERPPSPLRKPTWFDTFFSKGDIARIRFETPLDVKDGMFERQKRVGDELFRACAKAKDTPFLDKEKLGRLVTAYGLLFDEPSQKGNEEIEVTSEVASGLHLLKTEFEIDLPPYKVVPEEE